MPSHNCLHPTCSAILPARGYCPRHQPQAKSAKVERHRRYDQTQRDANAKKFYDSARWERARKEKLAAQPWCEGCKRAWASAVHHDIPLAKCTEEQKTDQRNLVSLCDGCHSSIEARRRAAKRREKCG